MLGSRYYPCASIGYELFKVPYETLPGEYLTAISVNAVMQIYVCPFED